MYGTDYKIAENVESIPREVALAYLQNESGRFADRHQCVYTNLGIGGTPYEELAYYQNPYGEPFVFILEKDGPFPEWLHSEEIVCFATALYITEQAKFTKEEIQEAINKTVSSLYSLGMRQYVEKE